MRSSLATSSNQTGDLQVRVFGSQAHSVDTDRLTVCDLHFPVTAGELLTEIAEAYPALAGSLGVSRIAINHEFAAPDCQIESGDEVALIGLISGG